MRFLLLAALVALLVGVAGAGAGSRSASVAPGLAPIGGAEKQLDHVPGELIVRFRSGVSSAARSSTLAAEGARPADSLGLPGLTLAKLSPGVSVAEAVAALEDDPDVLYAEPNYLNRVSVLPTDPMFSQLWGLSQASDKDIDAPSAWNQTTGSSNVVVAVVDSGVAYGHPDLNDNIWINGAEIVNGSDDDLNGYVDDVRGWDFVDDDNAPLDFNGHGTHVAGTIGAEGNNGTGVTGVNWDVAIMALRAGDTFGGLPNSAIIDAIDYACDKDADIVNGSFGSDTMSTAIRDAVAQPDCASTLFVFAAGNSGWNLNGNTGVNDNTFPCELHRPAIEGGANLQNVLCIGATGAADGIASFSNRGTLAVHLAAPGVGIRSTYPAFAAVPGFPDGFEGTATAFNNRWGPKTGSPAWNRTSAKKKKGTYSLTDSPGGLYPNHADTSIRRRNAFSLAGRAGCGLEYDLWLQSELNIDGVLIDLGTSTVSFENLTSFSGTTGGRFLHFFDDISALDDEAAVYLRFRFFSDFSLRFDGAYFDNVLVTCLAQSAAAYATLDGTSMAAPHAAGVAALLLADDPTMTVAQLKAALLAGVDVVPGLATHVQTSGRLNAAIALGLVLDDTPTDTTITSRPRNTTTSRRATFRFTGAEPGGRYQCKHMNGPWTACSSPKTYSGLGKGLHKFQVRSIDVNGNADPTPAVDTWRIV